MQEEVKNALTIAKAEAEKTKAAQAHANQVQLDAELDNLLWKQAPLNVGYWACYSRHAWSRQGAWMQFPPATT